MTTLSFAVLIAIIIILIPHSTFINPDEVTVGVDTEYYSDWQRDLFNSDSTGALLNRVFVEQATGDRPLFLLIQYGVIALADIPINEEDSSGTDHTLSTSIEYFLIVLSAAIVLTTYYLTREITHSERASLLSAILAAFSFQVLIGLYAGFYANMIALVFGYLTSIFVLRLLQRAEFQLPYLAAFIVCFIALYLTHVYTWTIFVTIIGIVLLIVYLRFKRYLRIQAVRSESGTKANQTPRIVLAIAIVIVSCFVADIARSALTGIPNGVARHLAIAEENAGAVFYLTRWENIQNTMFIFGGGVFANVIFLSLAVYWLLRSQSQMIGHLYLIVFLAAGIIPLILGDWILQSRILFNIPLQIPAGIAVSMIVARQENWRVLLVFTIYIFMIAEAVFSVSNFLPA